MALTRFTRGSGTPPEIDLWNLPELPKPKPRAAAVGRPILVETTMTIPRAERDSDIEALRRASKAHERATRGTSPPLHSISRIPRYAVGVCDPNDPTDKMSSLGVAIALASFRYEARTDATRVEGGSSSGSSSDSSRGASGRRATTAGGAAAGGGGGGSADGSSGAWRAETNGSLEGSSSRGSCKRSLDDDDGDGSAVGQQVAADGTRSTERHGQNADTSPVQIGEDRASKRLKLDSFGGATAVDGGGGGARGGAAGAGGRTVDTVGSNSGDKGNSAQRERNDDVPASRREVSELDQSMPPVRPPMLLSPGYSACMAGIISAMEEEDTVAPALVSTVDGGNSEATTMEGYTSGSGSSSSSSDGKAAAPPSLASTLCGASTRPTAVEEDCSTDCSSDASWGGTTWGARGQSASTAGGSTPPMIHVEDCVLTDAEADHDMASLRQEEHGKQADEASGALGTLGAPAAAAAPAAAPRAAPGEVRAAPPL